MHVFERGRAGKITDVLEKFPQMGGKNGVTPRIAYTEDLVVGGESKQG
jgi:hypothetical protein